MDNETTDWFVYLMRRMIFRGDGGLTLFGKIMGIVTLLFLFAACSALSGCVNLAYTRNPLSDSRIQRTYQSTETAFGISYVMAFPQIMNPTGGHGLMLVNIISIPLGCIGLVDTACEAVIDTICLPVDWPLAAGRKSEWEAWQQEQSKEMTMERSGVWKYKAPDGVNDIIRYQDGTESTTLVYVAPPLSPLPKDAVFIPDERGSSPTNLVQEAR